MTQIFITCKRVLKNGRLHVKFGFSRIGLKVLLTNYIWRCENVS